jgi:hypothetical protein
LTAFWKFIKFNITGCFYYVIKIWKDNQIQFVFRWYKHAIFCLKLSIGHTNYDQTQKIASSCKNNTWKLHGALSSTTFYVAWMGPHLSYSTSINSLLLWANHGKKSARNEQTIVILRGLVNFYRYPCRIRYFLNFFHLWCSPLNSALESLLQPLKTIDIIEKIG